MNCLEFRRRYLTDPINVSADIREHRVGCTACNAFAAKQDLFNRALVKGAAIPAPTGLASRILLRQSLRRNGGERLMPLRTVYAMAATLLLAVALTFGGLRWQQGHAVDRAVLAYLQANPATQVAATSPFGGDIDALLKPTGMALRTDLLPVRAAKRCVIKDSPAVHLVVAGEKGPVSVVVMPRQEIAERETFRQAGFKGVIVPCPKGSMAIVGVADEPIDTIERRVQAAVQWL